MTLPVYLPGMPCPCGCGATGSKLSFKTGHVAGHRGTPGCRCRPCIGRQNRTKGKTGERNRHKNLGGFGPTPVDESPHTYPLVVTTQDKKGELVPMAFRSFVKSEFYRHAMAQAVKKVPVGSDAHPALYLEPPGGGAWLVVDIAPKRKATSIGETPA